MTKSKKKNEVVILPRFTYGAWRKVHPGRSMEEYDFYESPFDFERWLVNMYDLAELEKLKENGIVKVRLIDGAYIEWLGEKEINGEAMMDYIHQMDYSNEDMVQMMEKEDLLSDYVLYFIPFCGILKSNNLPSNVPYAFVKNIENYLKQLLNSDCDDVFVSPYAYTFRSINGNEEEMLDHAKHYFTTGFYMSIPNRERLLIDSNEMDEHNSEMLLTGVGIPVVVRHRHKQSEFKIKELFSEYKDFGNTDKDFFRLMKNKKYLFLQQLIENNVRDKLPESIKADYPNNELPDYKEIGINTKEYCDFIEGIFVVKEQDGFPNPRTYFLTEVENLDDFWDELFGEYSGGEDDGQNN